MKEKFLITGFILTTLLSFSFNLKCGEEEIDHCLECGKGENSTTCIKCEDKHFLFFNNLLCLPCDHEYYGQKGCEGNCDGSKYKEERRVLCEEDKCKKGYYYVKGECVVCTKLIDGCFDCSFDDDKNKKICNECISKEFKLNKDFNLCDRCSKENCLKCHFNEDYTSTLCDECKEGYYVNSDNTCSQCKNVAIPNGNCKICSDNEQDINSKIYSCNQYYVLVGTNCIKCPDNCPYCEYNEVKKETECTRCKENYIINPNRKCTYCGENCEFCKLNENSEPICLFCNSKYFLSEGKCLNCPNNCQKCKIAENNQIKCVDCNKKYALLDGECKECPTGCSDCEYNKVYDRKDCKECNYNYALNKENQCESCSSIIEIGGEACESCGYNELSNKFECYNCKGYDSYAYINNKYQCLSNSDSSQLNLYGCVKANYNEKENKYECTKCKDYYIPIINEKICKYPSEISLSDFCLRAEKVELESGFKYSCIECENPYKKTKKLNNITDCIFSYNLDYCSNGEKDLNDIAICTECVKNAQFNKKKNVCQCNSDSFSIDENDCYKCDNEMGKNPGCDASEGCEYNDQDQFVSCKKCKSDYALYDKGICNSCSEIISNCNKCHLDKILDKLICDSCIDNYIINTKENICRLNSCYEYANIMPGCIICDDKLDEYMPKNKCQSCKPGYFKTKDESCIYCSSEKYGGTGCYECTYGKDENGQETENIVCKKCSSAYQALSSDGKCFNCQVDLNYGCQYCKFINNEIDNTEKLICTQCYYQYYLNSEGICINYSPQLKKIPYCSEYEYKIGNNIFKYNNNEDEFLYSSSYNINITKVDDQINTECKKCENGYYLNDYGKCIILTIEDCSLVSIIQNFPQRYTECKTFCDQKSYCYVDYVIKNYGKESNNDLIKANMSEIFEKNKGKKNLFSLLDDNIKSIIIDNKLCLSNSGKGSNEDSINLRKCLRSEYNIVNNSYICTKCINGYFLDYKTKTCKQNIENEGNYNCEIDNIGSSLNPKYSCKKCYNENDILVTIEDGVKLCLEAKGELENCKEATADTTYVKNLYNCTSCSDNYIPYYSKFYGRMICQNIYGEIEEEKNISLENFNPEDSKEGRNCLNNCFTPDGSHYYDCNDEVVGMIGCEGPCEFSLKKNNTIECKGTCQSEENDIFEISKGICEACNIVNEGCFECHYENEYPNDYFGIKRKRRFVCDTCDSKYIMSKFSKCLFCSNLLPNCEECENDKENNGEIKCIKCSEGFYLDDNGNCLDCKENQFQGNNGKCVNCDNTNEGGILGCSLCKKSNNEVICKLCKLGYILIKNMNICIQMSSNNELKKFGFCEQLTFDNNKYYCSKCKFQFSLIKEDNQNKCKYIPSLFDYFYSYYNDKKLTMTKKMLPLQFYKHFSFEKYLQYFIYDENEYLYYPCEEATNSGTIDKPNYSCTKCYTFSENNENNDIFTKIVDEKNNINFCIYRDYIHQLANCEEAKFIIKNGKKQYECIKCANESILYIHEDGHCEYFDQNKLCMVDKCLKCEFNNNYFCEICVNSDYEVNKYSGSCVKKTELIPAITWKDIFRLELNSVKKINNKEIYGPSLHLRGLTSYQINSYHAFLIYLDFKLKYSKNNRNLQEGIKIPAICQIEQSVAEVNDSVNIIDYDCIGNTNSSENLEEYELKNIVEGNNTGLLKQSNFEEIISNENLSDLIYKNDSNFINEDLNKIITFEMDEIKNITLQKYDSEFKINGKINKEINQTVMEAELNIIEINNLSASCKFIIEERNKSSLNCTINIKPYKDQKTFSFKTSEIITTENDIYLSKINEILLINEVNEDKKDEDNIGTKINIIIIIIVIAVCVVILGTGTFFVVCCWKKKCKRNKIEKEKNKSNEMEKPKIQDKSISKTIRSLYELK